MVIIVIVVVMIIMIIILITIIFINIIIITISIKINCSPKSKFAEVEIRRSRNWPKSKLADIEKIGRNRNWPKSTAPLGAHRNALGTFHHDQKHRLMAASKAWLKLLKILPTWALSRKLEGQIGTTVVGATLLFGCEVSGFSNKEEREYESLWSRVVFGITRQERGDLERDKRRLQTLGFPAR